MVGWVGDGGMLLVSRQHLISHWTGVSLQPWVLARGCLVYLRDTATGVTYLVVVRSVDTPVNMSSCPSSPNGPLSTGVYSVEVYDIERMEVCHQYQHWLERW